MSAPRQKRTGRPPGAPARRPRDPFAAAVRRALADDAARLAVVPAGGAAAAVSAGLRRRVVRRAWQVAGVVGSATVVVSVVAASVWSGPGSPGAEQPRPPAVGSTAPDTSSTSMPVTSAPTTSVVHEGAGSADAAAGDERSSVDRGPASDGAPATTVPPVPSTAPPPSTTTSTTTPPPAADPRLRVSTSPDRSGSIPLGGATLAGVVYVFWDHEQHPPEGGTVSFWIDDPSRSGSPHRVEHEVAYDLEATAPGGEAHGFDVTGLGAGTHTITVDAGGGVVVTSTFRVS